MVSIEKENTMVYEIMHNKWDKAFKKWIDNIYIPERVEKNIFKRIMIANKKRVDELADRNKIEKRETILINTDKFPIGTYVMAGNTKTIFMIDAQNVRDVSETVIIEHPIIAQAMYSVMDLIWEKSLKKEN